MNSYQERSRTIAETAAAIADAQRAVQNATSKLAEAQETLRRAREMQAAHERLRRGERMPVPCTKPAL